MRTFLFLSQRSNVQKNQMISNRVRVCPFEIIDTPREQPITLKRELNGESITVEVQLVDFGEDEGEYVDDDDDDDDGDDKENQSSVQPSVSMVVNVIKGEGPCLEFCCTAYPDNITIDGMFIKNPGTSADGLAYERPEFADLDWNLQKAAYKYVELRGINSSTTNFLHEYMTGKDNREYLGWLKSMMEFVEK